MATDRKYYVEAFKQESVQRLMVTNGKPIAQLACDLGIIEGNESLGNIPLVSYLFR